MKIMEKDGFERVVEVYAIYWFDEVRHHLVIPYKEFGGLMVVTEENCDVIDPSIDGFVLIKSGSGRDMFIHWATEKDALLDRMIDHDPEAMEEFERRLKRGRHTI